MTTTQFSAPPAPPAAEKAKSRAASSAGGGLSSLVLDIGVPVGTYYVARALGADLVTSLALSSVRPAVQSVVALLRGRAVDRMAILILVVNMAGVAVSFWTDGWFLGFRLATDRSGHPATVPARLRCGWG